MPFYYDLETCQIRALPYMKLINTAKGGFARFTKEPP